MHFTSSNLLYDFPSGKLIYVVFLFFKKKSCEKYGLTRLTRAHFLPASNDLFFTHNPFDPQPNWPDLYPTWPTCFAISTQYAPKIIKRKDSDQLYLSLTCKKEFHCPTEWGWEFKCLFFTIENFQSNILLQIKGRKYHPWWGCLPMMFAIWIYIWQQDQFCISFNDNPREAHLNTIIYS